MFMFVVPSSLSVANIFYTNRKNKNKKRDLAHSELVAEYPKFLFK